MNNLDYQQYIRKILNIEGERLENLKEKSKQNLNVFLLKIFGKSFEEFSTAVIDLSCLTFKEYEELKFLFENWCSCSAKKELFIQFITEYANKKTYIIENTIHSDCRYKIIATHMNLCKDPETGISYYHQIGDDIIITSRKEDYFEYKKMYYNKLKGILMPNYSDREQYEILIEECDLYRKEHIINTNNNKPKTKIK